MVGGFSTPKKDKAVKVASGESVTTGTILSRGISAYKAGSNVKGLSTLYALCDGKVYFTKRKTSHGRVRTYINIACGKKKSNS
ncbi:MAG: 50S ribosomal protein L27 [Candidatus Omnitrophota bacterium]